MPQTYSLNIQTQPLTIFNTTQEKQQSNRDQRKFPLTPVIHRYDLQQRCFVFSPERLHGPIFRPSFEETLQMRDVMFSLKAFHR